MGRFSRVTLPVLFLSVIALTGCQGLVPHDTQSLLDPNLKRSDILRSCGGFWNDLCRSAGLDRNVPASVKRRHEPQDGGNHGRLPDSMGVLRSVDTVATGDPMERGRCGGQLRERRCIRLLFAKGKSQVSMTPWISLVGWRRDRDKTSPLPPGVAVAVPETLPCRYPQTQSAESPGGSLLL
jgi:hypothetical protein